MADNWIQSFAVALGFDVDTSSLGTAKKSIADYEAAVKAAEKRIEDARWAGAKTEEEIAKLTRETNLKAARDALADAQAREKLEADASRKRTERNVAFLANLERIKLVAEAAAKTIHYAVLGVTSAFDHLGFVSARTGASVQSLNSLGYAFKQVGGTSEQAVSAVESFTKALRENSGVKGFVQGLGVDMTKDKADQLLDTVRILQGHGYDAGSREAALAGISEENYALLTKYIDELDRYRAEYNKLTASLGVDSKQATEVSMAFHRSLTRLQATASALGDKLMASLAPALQRIVDRFQDWIRSNPEKVERVMNDISKALVWVAEKIGTLIGSFTGNNGDEFLKRWDEIVTRTERFAGAVERSTLAIERLLKMTGLLNREAVPGLGGLVTDYRNLGHRLFGGDGTPGAGAIGGFNPLESGGASPSAEVPDNRKWYEKVLPKALGGKDAPGRAEIGGWWTPERQQHAIDTLMKGGVSELGAKALVARWSAVEAGDGPTAVNPKTGAFGIGQWLGPRQPGIAGNTDFDAQLQYALKELHSSEGKALTRLNSAKTARDAAIGATMFERAGGWNAATGTDNFTDKTETAMGLLGRQPDIAPSADAGRVDELQGSAQHRHEAIAAHLKRQLTMAGIAAGVHTEVFSGGQDPEHQYGSTRHNHGNAADVRLYRIGPDGKKVYLNHSNPADRAIMEKYLRASVAAGATGIGAGPGYMGDDKMHVGGGTPAYWGAGNSSATAPDWVRRAYLQGMEDRQRRTALPVAAAPRINMTPGGFDVNRIDPQAAMKPAAPMGASSVTNSSANDNRAVHQTFNTNTTIHGARDTREAGRMMENTFGRMHGLAMENAQSAIA